MPREHLWAVCTVTVCEVIIQMNHVNKSTSKPVMNFKGTNIIAAPTQFSMGLFRGKAGSKGSMESPFDRPLTFLVKLLKILLEFKSVYQSHIHLPRDFIQQETHFSFFLVQYHWNFPLSNSLSVASCTWYTISASKIIIVFMF